MPSPITQLLQDWNLGDAKALEKLMPDVYDWLRSIALRALTTPGTSRCSLPNWFMRDGL
jgi:hypothetical protein